MHLHTRFYREYLGLSLRYCAQLLDMSSGQLSEKERGYEAYTLPQIGRTVQLFGLPIGYLLEVPFTPREGMLAIPPPPREHLVTIALTKGG